LGETGLSVDSLTVRPLTPAAVVDALVFAGRSKVTCFVVGDLSSVSLLRIGTIVVVIGDVFTVVVDVCELREM
jgi:hypothetical protein